MKLSVPVYRLKRQARVLARQERIPLHEALDRIARQEGFSRWSLLSAKTPAVSRAREILAELSPGDLVLVGARPRQGKTLLCLELTIEAMKTGARGMFFTLEYTEADIVGRFEAVGENPAEFNDRFVFDNSDHISASYIIEALTSAPPGTVVVIDYLQLLDQKRENPALMDQVQALKAFARDRGLIILIISQIDRYYDPAKSSYPDLDDVRLPNPLDLTLFTRACFLNDGEITSAAIG
jgi:replicative DNA helicase